MKRAVLLLAVALGCSSISGIPPQKNRDAAFEHMRACYPGADEQVIRYYFPMLNGGVGSYGILEVNRYVGADGYSSNTYWIGYNFVELGGYLSTRRVVSYTCVNGRIESAFFTQ